MAYRSIEQDKYQLYLDAKARKAREKRNRRDAKVKALGLHKPKGALARTNQEYRCHICHTPKTCLRACDRRMRRLEASSETLVQLCIPCANALRDSNLLYVSDYVREVWQK